MKFYSKKEQDEREKEFQDNLSQMTWRFEEEDIDGAGFEGFGWKTFKQGLTMKNIGFRIKSALGLDKPFKV
ncbi:hypothetical protein LGN04_02040 [Burkholderia multivorans]|uniref:hypothetical protein n=1 Tax=Burkholderia multivorans TaxID=87883 RepID=UPI001C21ED1B|nr:hypothetical protein [Burkholderia multivorans]MBU9118429.1 hypothetical protein [Burkholderia multivorans]MBU9434124.1 hypothetical protein [Burkholderia multivorans]MCA8452698.1 hypothetical protein [Burkholderia multivorans]MDN8018124.1 hypothetical protein [Burkholderia multivorans]